MYTYKELAKLTEKELHQELEDSRKNLFKEKTELTTGQSKTPHKVRLLSKYIAQILTALNNK